MIITYVIIAIIAAVITFILNREEFCINEDGKNKIVVGDMIAVIIASLICSIIISVAIFIFSTFIIGMFAPKDNYLSETITEPFHITHPETYFYQIEFIEESEQGFQYERIRTHKDNIYFKPSEESKIEIYNGIVKEGWWYVFSQTKWEDTDYYIIYLPQEEIDALWIGK